MGQYETKSIVIVNLEIADSVQLADTQWVGLRYTNLTLIQ